MAHSKGKLAQHWHTLRNSAKRTSQHGVLHHAHNLAYCCYYGIALAEDRGAKLVVITILFLAAIVSTITSVQAE